MTGYDFKQLSPYDFEVMSRDILQVKEKILLESFKNGRDGGIDFRYAPVSGKKIIVQCKHYAGTGLQGLLRDLKKEAVKVMALQPNRYILITSVPLSPENKKSIAEIFSPFIVQTSDVIGPDDLNNFLGLHSEIEKKHYKLWLASTAVLQTVLHNAEITRTSFEVERIHGNLKRYVQSDGYQRALKILEKEKVVIISGQPGVGKTTLAEMLLYTHLEQGFEPIVVGSDIQEARKQYSAHRKQIFYYDDFLGTTFLGEHGTFLQKNEDQDILRFIEMVQKSKSSRLVLTTREHILGQAIEVSEKLFNARIIDQRCILDIGDYSYLQKARILYNHIYFSELPLKYRLILLKDDFYTRVLKHKNFNPRLIEWLSSYERIQRQSISPEKYQDFIIELLNNPSEIWRRAYETQISDTSRSLLLSLHSLEGNASIDSVMHVFKALNDERAKKYNYKTAPQDARNALKQITDAFITSKGAGLSFINPSIKDVMNRAIYEHPDNALDIINAAVRFQQIFSIWKIAISENGTELIKYLVEKISFIVPKLEQLVDAEEYIKTESGLVRVDTGYDERLECIVEMAEKTRCKALLDLIKKIEDQVIKQVSYGGVGVRSAVNILDVIEECTWEEITEHTDYRGRLLEALLKRISSCQYSRSLFEILKYIKDADIKLTVDQEAIIYQGYKDYISLYFEEDLRDCNNKQAYEDIIDSLDFFSEYFKERPDSAIEIANKELKDFERDEEEQANFREDEWKERYYAEKEANNTVSEMFGSLTPHED